MTESVVLDLNCDLGEGYGAYTCADDEALLPWVTSANVACGFHAGDPRIMQRTVELARAAGVGVGAQPGLPDLGGFGRRAMAVTPEEVRTDTLYQIGALGAFCRAAGVPLQHVKPHGALYHMVDRDVALAAAFVGAARAWDKDVWIIGPPRGCLQQAAAEAGLRFCPEVFADRGYLADGRLAPRGQAGALVTEPARAAQRALQLAREGTVQALDGSVVTLVERAWASGAGAPAGLLTICIHGDTPGAVEIARAVRQALDGAGLPVRPLGVHR